MSQTSATPRDTRLRFLERWAIAAMVFTSLVPLVPYALNGLAS